MKAEVYGKTEISMWLRSQGEECDKYDYFIAAFCGISAGLIDVFFVGVPGKSVIGEAVDNVADGFVKKAAQAFWQCDKRKGRSKRAPETLQQCISYLEQAFPVCYDARYAKDLAVEEGTLSGMWPKNHHLRSLAHAPDIIGLIFSIIDQFTDMASFIDDGRIIRVYPRKKSKAIPYMQGTNLPSRLFCGFVNWIGHLISDLVGASSTRQAGKTGRGMGIPIPFYELFLLCEFGDFDGKSFAEIAVNAYESGYDLRHGASMAIPVLLNDAAVRVLWSLKRHIYHKYEWKECIPTNRHQNLRWMLIISDGALCFVDGLDAAVRSGGNMVGFVLHLNLVAWMKLIFMILKEIAIRYSFTYEDLKNQYQRLNVELEQYVAELKRIDYTRYEKELGEISAIHYLLADNNAGTEQIYSCLQTMDIYMQFHNFEEFDRKMQDKDFVLEI